MRLQSSIVVLFLVLALVLVGALQESEAVSTVRFEIESAEDIEIHEFPTTSSGLVIEASKITFVATAVVTVHVVSGDEDERHRGVINGRRSNAFRILAENCVFTLYKPRLPRNPEDDGMETMWQKSLEAFERLKDAPDAGHHIALHMHQPDIDIRQSVAKRISGVGSAHFVEGEAATKPEE